MKFVHVEDTHLGKKDGNIEERMLDFFNAFKCVVDYAVDNGVDFVVHSGDLFDKPRPSVKTLVFAVNQLQRLKEKGIPLFLIPGSHDTGVGETIIALFDELKLLKNLASQRYFELVDGKIMLGGEMYKNVFLCGIAGKRANIEEIYRRIVPKSGGSYRIFMFHHTISDISEKFADIPTSLLPKGFDYYAAGHWHGFFEERYGGGTIVYPGSTEFNDIKEAEGEKNRYFCVVDTETNRIEKVKLHPRRHLIYKINCSGLDAKDIADRCISEIKEISEGAVLVIKLKGKLGSGTKAEINRSKILEWAREKRFLFTKIYLGDLENPERPSIGSEIKSPSRIEDEYLKKQNYTAAEIRLAKDIITLIGNASKKDIDFVKDEIIKIVEGALIENTENKAP